MRVTPTLTVLALLSTSLLSALPAVAEEVSAHKNFEVGAVLTSDLIGNVSGGVRRGGLMMHNLDLTASWQGDHGWEAFGYVLEDVNGGFSGKYAGDTQTASNIDAKPGLRLFEAYVKKTSDDRAWSGTFGLINLNGLFDVQDVGSLFLNSSHGIGPDYSQAGPSIFPISALGAVAEWRGNDHFAVRAGIFDGVPGDVNDDTRFAYIRLGKDEGAHVVVEGEYDADRFVVKLGHWANTLATPTLDGLGSRKSAGTYGQAQVTLSSEAQDPDQGLKAWVRAGIADEQTLSIDRYVGGGLVYAGPIPGRDDDSVGLAIANAHFGGPYQTALGIPLATETSFELTYQAVVAKGLSLKPDIQYIRHPSGDTAIKDAVVVGVRLTIDLMAF